jgi:hypothetical protein
MRIKIPESTTLLRLSVLLTLFGLVFMVWSLVMPTPMPVILAMSVGQGIGILAFGLYVFVVLRELRRQWQKERS